MTTATVDAPGVKLKDLRAFPRGVSTAIAALVNNRGVKYRIFKDGNHLVLYPPDRDARPFKISAHRPEEANLRYLTDFVEKYLGPLPPDDRPAKPDELAPLLTLNGRPPEQRAAPDAETNAQQSAGPWRVHHRRTGEPTTFETDGTTYRCLEDGCPWTTTKVRAIGAHAANHKSAKLAKTDGRMTRRAKPWTGSRATDKTPLDGARVRELRDRSGLTWKELGRAVGITPEGIRQWTVRGEAPSVWIEPFARALGVTPEVLTGSGPLPELPPVEPPPSAQSAAQAPAEPTTAPESEPPALGATDGHEAHWREVLRIAMAALGEHDHGAELAETRAELVRVRAELDEANTRLDLLAEAWEGLKR